MVYEIVHRYTKEWIMSSDYSSYGDWYDNGPGSERWKRELAEDLKMPAWKTQFIKELIGEFRYGDISIKKPSYKRMQEEYEKIIEREKRVRKGSENWEEFISDEDLFI